MYTLSSKAFSLSDLKSLIFENKKIKLSEALVQSITDCRDYFDQKIASTSDPIYGINTGFGSLCDVKIDSDNLRILQENLVRSERNLLRFNYE